MASSTMAKQRTKYAYRRVPGNASYDGSAARQLEREEGLTGRPLVRPREKALSRPRIRVREAGKVSVFAIVGFAAVAVCAMLLLLGYVQLAQLSNDVVSLQSEVNTLRGEEAKLRVQYELAYDLSSIEQAMTSSGTMIHPRDSQICYVDLSEPDGVELLNETRPVKGVEGILDSLRSIGGQVVEYFR
ncbi:hypothetical protein D1159_01860 [Pseudoflavonifractor sp. 524-17]|uniref:hypothetical protein n=1 Tax=Pseudoflavonifractor sp. 524-17 TaxID=2304577 RepID=UPI00137B86DA|nr:hypothetical protein [Pseudoflavonifractor sp. 524-17]NCE63352.1 hypothetical protein [Pseudoflavonifractor sp. 524-17]